MAVAVTLDKALDKAYENNSLSEILDDLTRQIKKLQNVTE